MPVVKASATVGRHWTTCAELRLNSLKGSFTFVLEGSTRKITWTDAVSPIKVVSAAFVVTWYTQSSTEVPDGQCDLAEALWPSTSAGAISLPASSHTDDYYSRHTLSVVIVTPDDGLFSWERRIEQESKAAAVHCAAAVHAQAPSDVVLDFSHVGKQLWTSEAFLSATSPYFKAIFESGFDEASTKTSELSHLPSVEASYAFVESDAETDEVDLKSSKTCKAKVVAPYKRIVVTETAYSTYFAVLVWMQSRHIEFAPLASSFRSASSSSEAGDAPVEVPSRKSKVQVLMVSQNPVLPPPVSPKSVYRLADYLSLDDLKSLALANLVSQLTPTNVAYELYSDMATYYLPVRDAVLAYAVDHWSEVKDAPATVEMEERGAAGELGPAAAGTGMLLARRLAEKLGK
ncbi:hypothetical protein JCM8208_004719 [Rhodotorula glutinis]